MSNVFVSKKGKFETRTAFPKGEGLEELPIEQVEREILYSIYNASLSPTEKEKGAQLNLVKMGWVDTFNPTEDERDKFEYHIERLKRFNLINWSGSNDWANPKEVFVYLRPDGFHIGMGYLRKKEAEVIIRATDMLLVNFDKICFERDTIYVEEKEVLDSLHLECPDIPSPLVNHAINWLLVHEHIKIEEPGQKRGRWWVRTGGYVRLISHDNHGTVSASSEGTSEQEVIFQGPPEEIARFFKDLKDWHEEEMVIIKEVQSRMEILVKQAEEKGDSTLRQDALKWLSRVIGIETLYDLLQLIQRAIIEHPEWVTDIVPPALSNLIKIPELPSMDRIG